jgi:hypothetical protein
MGDQTNQRLRIRCAEYMCGSNCKGTHPRAGNEDRRKLFLLSNSSPQTVGLGKLNKFSLPQENHN